MTPGSAGNQLGGHGAVRPRGAAEEEEQLFFITEAPPRQFPALLPKSRGLRTCSPGSAPQRQTVPGPHGGILPPPLPLLLRRRRLLNAKCAGMLFCGAVGGGLWGHVIHCQSASTSLLNLIFPVTIYLAFFNVGLIVANWIV